ncbi:MAG: hypothetical protein M3T56_09630 [Chloroflexota bacterium]|nr:hypothetical protein [Chloroflexota bacterium]
MAVERGASNTRIWVLDATPLWGFSSVNLIDTLVSHAPGRLKVTPVVYGELRRRSGQRPFLQLALAAIDGGLIEKVAPTRAEQRLTLSLHSSLFLRAPRNGKDLGEAETIVVAGSRGWNAVIDEQKARNVLPLRYRGCDAYCTPQVMLALALAGRLTMDEAHEKLQAMTRAPNFQHEFAGKSRAKWMAAPNYYGPVPF